MNELINRACWGMEWEEFIGAEKKAWAPLDFVGMVIRGIIGCIGPHISFLLPPTFFGGYIYIYIYIYKGFFFFFFFMSFNAIIDNLNIKDNKFDGQIFFSLLFRFSMLQNVNKSQAH